MPTTRRGFCALSLGRNCGDFVNYTVHTVETHALRYVEPKTSMHTVHDKIYSLLDKEGMPPSLVWLAGNILKTVIYCRSLRGIDRNFSISIITVLP